MVEDEDEDEDTRRTVVAGAAAAAAAPLEDFALPADLRSESRSEHINIAPATTVNNLLGSALVLVFVFAVFIFRRLQRHHLSIELNGGLAHGSLSLGGAAASALPAAVAAVSAARVAGSGCGQQRGCPTHAAAVRRSKGGNSCLLSTGAALAK